MSLSCSENGVTLLSNELRVHGDENFVRGDNCKIYGNRNHIFGKGAVIFGDSNAVYGVDCDDRGLDTSFYRKTELGWEQVEYSYQEYMDLSTLYPSEKRILITEAVHHGYTKGYINTGDLEKFYSDIGANPSQFRFFKSQSRTRASNTSVGTTALTYDHISGTVDKEEAPFGDYNLLNMPTGETTEEPGEEAPSEESHRDVLNMPGYLYTTGGFDMSAFTSFSSPNDIFSEMKELNVDQIQPKKEKSFLSLIKTFKDELSDIGKGEPSCSVCMMNLPVIAFNCGHKKTCCECSIKVLEGDCKCPSCREAITFAIKIFE